MTSTLVAALTMSTQTPLPPDGQSWDVRSARVVPMRFLISLPEGYDATQKKRWPVILFLHGAGERGDDLAKVRVHGPMKEIANGRKLPFIVIAPQCPENQVWDPHALAALLDMAEKKYKIDRTREYLTGLSMGGYGTWALVADQPERFAAAAPICGGGGAHWIAPSRYVGTPIWSTHGDADPAVPIAEDQRIVDAVRQAGGDVRFDVIPGAGHDVWTKVYASQELYDWFLTHQRSQTTRRKGS